MIGGKDQLKLDEDTRACLSPSPWSGGPRLAKPPQRDRPCSPRSGGLGWLARPLLAALEHASVCTRGPTDAQVQLGAWGERPRKQQRRSRFPPPDPTGRLRLQDSRDGPQAAELSPSPPPCRWGRCGPKTRMMPRVCSTPKGGCRKRAELHGPSFLPLARPLLGRLPLQAPLGQSACYQKEGRAQRHKAITAKPQAPAAGELVSNFGMRGAFWHASSHTLRGQLIGMGPSLSPPL